MINRFYLVQGKNGKKLKFTTQQDAESVGVIIASFTHSSLMVSYFCTKLGYYSEEQAQKVMLDRLENKLIRESEDWLNV